MTLQQNEYENIVRAAGIQPEEVSKFHLAWGLRDGNGKWEGKILVELTRGRGPRGGKKGRNRFALIDTDSQRACAVWNTKLAQGWRRTIRLEGDELVLAPERPPPPNRRAAIAWTKQKQKARALACTKNEDPCS